MSMIDIPNFIYTQIATNYGYYLEKVPQNVLDELGQQINNLKSGFNKGTKYNTQLAGEIEHEYRMLPQFQTKQYIKDLSQRFENESQHITNHYDSTPTLKFNDLWVNFQKKHEYNPIHTHTGVYSFVIWYQVPYTFEDEQKYSHSSEPINHGEFSFLYPSPFNTSRQITTKPLNIDKSKEGYIAIFPSSLNHLVYPFYSSDEYRITIAGNIEEKNQKS